MTNPATMTSGTGKTAAPTTGTVTKTGESALSSSHGSTTISDVVVQKVAGIATREVSGVHSLGSGASRAFNALRERIPGATASAGQGVAVEVGDRQAAIDLQILVEYGVSITDLTRSVRRNVITAVEQTTGLEVVEVNINVSDVHLPGDDDTDEHTDTGRVQ